MIFDNQRL
jgi:hypothetical protein